MKLSVTTKLFRTREDNSEISLIESMRKCKALGFDVLDISFTGNGKNKIHPLSGDNWEAWVDEIANEAQSWG